MIGQTEVQDEIKHEIKKLVAKGKEFCSICTEPTLCNACRLNFMISDLELFNTRF